MKKNGDLKFKEKDHLEICENQIKVKNIILLVINIELFFNNKNKFVDFF